MRVFICRGYDLNKVKSFLLDYVEAGDERQ